MKKPDSIRLDEIGKFRLTVAERKEWERLAVMSGVSFSAWVRRNVKLGMEYSAFLIREEVPDRGGSVKPEWLELATMKVLAKEKRG